jgi:hypothetical protein
VQISVPIDEPRASPSITVFRGSQKRRIDRDDDKGMALLMSEGIEGALFAEGTRTGDWFAIGEVDVHRSVAPPPPVDVPRVSGARRTFVRVLGSLLILATLAILVRLATHAPARQAILRWGLFGQSERILQTKAPL